jgi:ankyrin repeat protein
LHQDTTPLLEAVRQGDVEVCRLLLDRGADATKRGAEGLNAVELTW